MKKKSIKILWLILTAVFAVLTAIFVVGSYIANIYSSAINAYFDIVNYRTEQVEDGDDIDSEYYKSSFVTSNGNYDDEALWDYDLRVAEQIVSEGSVLLWNNGNALPLAKGAAVSCFSNTSVNMVYTGSGSGTINIANAVTLKDGLEKYDFKVNQQLWDFYATGNGSSAKGYGLTQRGAGGIDTNGDMILLTNEVPWSVIEQNGLESTFSAYGDAAIYVLGRSGGEGGDLQQNKAGYDTIGCNYLELSETEKAVLDTLVAKKEAGVFKKVILLLNYANVMQMDLLSQYSDSIDACMWIGEPGAAGIPGVAKLLCGDSAPSGHLVDTMVYDNMSSPAMTNFYINRYSNSSSYSLQNYHTAYTLYQEGIYVGYRYYETRYEDVVTGRANVGSYDYDATVAYPFGFGLSYTTFSFDGFSVKQLKDGNFEVKVTVRNTGKVAGRQVAQIYLQKPYTEYAISKGIETSAVQLVGYAKTKVLEPEQTQELTITVDDTELKTYDSEGYGTYILDAGKYYFAVGENAHDALNNILAAKPQKYTTANGMTANGNASLADSFEVNNIDSTTYAVSEHTGVAIINQFDNANINKYTNNGGQSVTWLARNDWTGTYPSTLKKLLLNDKMVTDLADKRDIAETAADAEAYFAENGKIQYSQDNGMHLIEMLDNPNGWDDDRWDALLDQMSWDDQAELCSNGYHTSCAVPSIDKPATRDENGPLGISVTFSTAKARSSMGWPCEPTRAATFNKDLSELFGKCLGEDMLHAGVTGLWGYGLNIHRTPYSGRNFEYYSEDSFLSGETCSYETIGAQSKGSFIMVKHFVANDSESQRHGNNEWMTEQTLRELYLRAFEKEFTEGGAWATMTSYNRLGTEWAGGCYNLLTNVLRKEWGFKGFCSSDYTNGTGTPYMNAYTGIQAGCDTYDSNYHKSVYDGLQDNQVFQYCLRMSSKYISNAIVHTAVMNGITPSTRVIIINTWWQNALIGAQIGFGALTATFFVLFVFSWIKNRDHGEEQEK